MGLLSNRLDRGSLKPGDHIYSWRTAYIYAHHGPIQQNSRIAKPDKGHALDIPKTHVSIFNAAPLRLRGHTLTAEDHSRPQRRLHVDPCPTRDPLRPPTATSEILGNPSIGLAYK
ncbi:hypothetical protein Tco_0963861 [Tanacetum coccineum]